jgi:hypothetical protein
MAAFLEQAGLTEHLAVLVACGFDNLPHVLGLEYADAIDMGLPPAATTRLLKVCRACSLVWEVLPCAINFQELKAWSVKATQLQLLYDWPAVLAS